MVNKNIFSYIKVGLILALIAAVCGISIALLNSVTAPIIEKNAYEKEQKTLSLIYENAEFKEWDIEIREKAIEKIYSAYVDGKRVGDVYIVSGKNAYGKIQLMIGLKDGYVTSIVMTTNTQSFGKLVNQYVDELNEQTITNINVSNLDVKCGATYGAKLVRSLIETALEHNTILCNEGGANNG